MRRMLRFLRRNIWFLAAIAVVFCASSPAGRAESAAKIAKHARKIEKRLDRFRAGTLVQIDFRDDSRVVGTLGALSADTFQIANSDNNKLQSFHYTDVVHAKKTKEYIGAGSVTGHHIRRWVPILAGALIAGGGIAAYETLR